MKISTLNPFSSVSQLEKTPWGPVTFDARHGSIDFPEDFPLRDRIEFKGKNLSPYLRHPTERSDQTVYTIHPAKIGALHAQGLSYRYIHLSGKPLESEWPQTRGEFRSLKPEGGMTYPALASVLHGEVHVVQQRSLLSPGAISDLMISPLKQREWAVLLPDFGVVFVNASGKDAVIGVVESEESKEHHEPYKTYKGPAYYPMWNEGELDWRPNIHYKELCTPRWVHHVPTQELEIVWQQGLLQPVLNHPEGYKWLTSPEEYLRELPKSYRTVDQL